MYLTVLLVKLIRKPTNTFVVENGKIYQEEFSEGFVIRDEILINLNNESSGTVPIRAEGDKVAKGESIYRYCVSNEDEINAKIKELDLQIQDNIVDDNSYFSSDIKIINSQIDSVLEKLYESNDLQSISRNKNEISNYLTKKMKIRAENSNNENLKKLLSQRNEYEKTLTNQSEYINAERSGVISYKIDGLEDKFKTDDFSYLNEQFLKDINIETNQIIASSNDKGKIVDNFSCYIACVLNSEEASNSEVGKSIKLRLQNSEEIPAKIVYKSVESTNKVLLAFEIDNSVTDLIQYRKIAFDVIWWSNSGLKIPNSAIKYEGNLAYIIRNRSGLKEKIYIKILRQNDKYSVVENYSYTELKEAGCDMSQLGNKKSISVYDEIEI